MKSRRGFMAALTLLLAIPIALSIQVTTGVESEIPFHFIIALSSILIALVSSDFRLPRAVAWLGRVAGGAAATVFFLQGVSLIVRDDTLSYLAFQVLGQEFEAALVDALILWFAGLCVWTSQGWARAFGLSAVTLAMCYELYRYALVYGGGEAPGILKLTLLLPFVWLLFESRKKDRINGHRAC